MTTLVIKWAAASVILLACVSGVLKASAYYSNIDEALRYAKANTRAAQAIKNAEQIKRTGIIIHILSGGVSSTTVAIPMRSETLNSDASIQLYSLPTTDEIINRSRNWSTIHRSAGAIVFNVQLQETGVRDYIKQSTEGIEKDSHSAQYVIDGNTISVRTHEYGRHIDIEAIMQQVKSRLRDLNAQPITTVEQEVQPNTTADNLEANIDFARRMLNWKGITLLYNGYSSKLRGRDIVPMIEIDRTNTVSINLDAFRAKLKLFAGSLIDKPAISPLFKIVNNRLAIREPGAVGQDVNSEEIANNIAEYLTSVLSDPDKNQTDWQTLRYRLSIQKQEPWLTMAKANSIGITNMLGSARISYKGSSKDRIHNITLGASRISGMIIEPGKEFSLVTAIGYAATTTGYKEEYVIRDNRSRKEAGGGLCQLATTFFRAVLAAGLAVTERHNHTYVVSYYGPGLDAGIYDIEHDFKFINDTISPILVQAYTNNSELIVELLGKNDGRTSVTTKPVETKKIDPPPAQYYFSKMIPFGKTECTDRPRKGMTTFATTTITYSSGKTRTRLWRSVYAPWPKICIIGTKGLDIFQYDD